MRSAKRYTNVGFTKRVDHDGGRHRSARAPAEPTVCRGCGAVHVHRRWNRSGSVPTQEPEPVARTLCLACRKVRDGAARGYVYIEGAFLQAHGAEIRHLLDNEAARAAEDNPLGRMMDWVEDPSGRVTVTTTTEHLAQRLGHALEKAFTGEVRYDFSHENKLARVYWRRD